ncbi:MAG: zinc ribbon domain-containing protein [Myxococcales bacterium]|nr:zinc ribbon domain-containing protein [Myxococcales bacterium]
MPIFEYRCECGKRMDVLVRGGKEPCNCEEAGEASDWCMKARALTRAVTAAHVASGARDTGRSYNSGTGAEVAPADCGHCGQTPGSCEN